MITPTKKSRYRGLFTAIRKAKGSMGEFDVVWMFPNGDWAIRDVSTEPNPENFTPETMPTRISVSRLTYCASASELQSCIDSIICN